MFKDYQQRRINQSQRIETINTITQSNMEINCTNVDLPPSYESLYNP